MDISLQKSDSWDQRIDVVHLNKSRWWFQTFLEFSPLLGEDFQFDSYFSDGLKPPTSE